MLMLSVTFTSASFTPLQGRATRNVCGVVGTLPSVDTFSRGESRASLLDTSTPMAYGNCETKHMHWLHYNCKTFRSAHNIMTVKWRLKVMDMRDTRYLYKLWTRERKNSPLGGMLLIRNVLKEYVKGMIVWVELIWLRTGSNCGFFLNRNKTLGFKKVGDLLDLHSGLQNWTIEVLALLGCYTGYVGVCLPTFQNSLSVQSSWVEQSKNNLVPKHR